MNPHMGERDWGLCYRHSSGDTVDPANCSIGALLDSVVTFFAVFLFRYEIAEIILLVYTAIRVYICIMMAIRHGNTYSRFG